MWQLLDIALATSSWQDSSYLAGGNGDGGIQLRPHDGSVRPSAVGPASRGGGMVVVVF
jgi:hypothetical protein